jgi:Tfp pilus assembly protein PilV
MTSAAHFKSNAQSGVTIIEVLTSALLIFIGLGAIFAMNTQSMQILRSTRLLANGSQILQERMESLRSHPWPEVANAPALAQLLQTPAPSERELGNFDLTETVIISIPDTPGAPKKDNSTFKLQRRDDTVRVIQSADLTAQPLLLVDMTIAWQEKGQTKQRQLRTIIGRAGLTRSGIFGSAFGRPAMTSNTAQASL